MALKGEHIRRGPNSPKVVQITEWTEADLALMAQLEAESPLASKAAKATLARRAVEAHRQCLELDGMVRTQAEQRALNQANGAYRATLAMLRVADKTVDDGEL